MKSPVGVEANVHAPDTAFELKPFPLTETTVPETPFVGDTEIAGTTVNVAVNRVGSPGFPVTVTVQGDPSAVASELTTKLPVAVPEPMEHVGLT